MTDRERANESTASGLTRRTVLRGTALAGFAGAGLTGTASATGEREITFCAAGEDVFEYRFEVDGEVERGGTYESDEFDEVGEDFAKGAVADERCDSFLFTGEIVEVRLRGPGKVLVEGKVVEDTTDDEELPNAVTVEADETAEYQFRVSGEVEYGPKAEPDEDAIDGRTVRGLLDGGGTDSYRYSGALAFDETTGPVTVTLDVNPE